MHTLGRTGVSRHRVEVIGCVTVLSSLLALGGGQNAVLSSPRESVTAAASAPKLGSLASVSCTSAEHCIAVGYQDDASKPWPLAEAWDGSTWTVMDSPIPRGAVSGSLSGVSCSAANACLAVGSYASQAQQAGNVPLAELWNGRTWKITAALLPEHASSGGLTGASCTSAHACVAVGFAGKAAYAGTALAESWNGKTWAVMATPKPRGAVADSFYGVSCSAARACLAVGYFATEDELRSANGEPLAEAWDGGTWRVTPLSPSDSLLSGVSCTSANMCVAVGDNGLGTGGFWTEAERWNGKTWRTVPIPSLMDSSTLGAVSCRSAAACVTVGSYDTNDARAAYVTLAEAWNGGTWKLLGTANPASAASSFLEGVSCWSAGSCVAVGHDASSSQLNSGTGVPLAERWNGTHWSVTGGTASRAAIHVDLRSSRSTIWTADEGSASARLTATFTQGAKPLMGLQVEWRTTAGKLSATSTRTGPDGTTSVTLTQPADVKHSATAAVTATDAQATGAYRRTDVTFLPDVVSIFPGPRSGGPWDWTAACPSVPAVRGGCASRDPNLGDIHMNGNLWNLGAAATGALSMGTDSSGTLDVHSSFSAAPAGSVFSNTWVRGYPNSLYGINLGYQDTSPPEVPSLELPMRIDDIPSDLVATTAYSLSISSPLTYDVSYDMWVNPSEGMTDRGQGTVEVMVWTDDSGASSYPSGTPVSATVPYSVGGVASSGVNAWDLYVSNIRADGQTGGPGGQAYGTVYFIPKNPLGVGAGQHLSIDLSAVFADLASVLQSSTYNWTGFAGTYWLDTIPFGVEFGPGGMIGAGAAAFSLDLSTYCLGVGVTVSKPAC